MILSSKDKSYTEVARITDNFRLVIGSGGSGTVYLGHLSDGTDVAVKVKSISSGQGFRVFETEVSCSK